MLVHLAGAVLPLLIASQAVRFRRALCSPVAGLRVWSKRMAAIIVFFPLTSKRPGAWKRRPDMTACYIHGASNTRDFPTVACQSAFVFAD